MRKQQPLVWLALRSQTLQGISVIALGTAVAPMGNAANLKPHRCVVVPAEAVVESKMVLPCQQLLAESVPWIAQRHPANLIAMEHQESFAASLVHRIPRPLVRRIVRRP